MTRVLHYVAVMNRGGEETLIMSIFRVIDRKSVTFDFLCTLNEKGAYDDEIYALGGEIYHQELGYCRVPILDRMHSLSIFLRENRDRFDVFHIHTQQAMDGYMSACTARKAGIRKVIVHSHSTSTLYHPFFHRLFRPLLARVKVTRLACSDMAGKWLYGNHSEYTVLKNGIDTSLFSYSEARRNEVRKENGWTDYSVIGHVGSFTHPKNHPFILEVFRQYLLINPKALLVLTGEGPLRTDIENTIVRLDLEGKVILTGARPDVNGLLQGFDLFLFPSLYEGLPVSLVEAQCSGLKCLISDTITEEVLVTDNVCRLSLDLSPSSWAERINALLSDGTERKDMSPSIREAGYDIRDTAGHLKNIYCS